MPKDVPEEVRCGAVLVGDDLSTDGLATWFEQEREAFFNSDAGNSDVDPWYGYMRYVNRLLGFSRISGVSSSVSSVLVLGPGSGIEIEDFAKEHPSWMLSFLEASESFSLELRRKWPTSTVVAPQISGDIALQDETQGLVCAFSVLHHIPNVSKVMREIFRVTKPGGTLLVREPCSSMGDWRGARSATPNERGIARKLMVEIAERAGFELRRSPVPILLEPINKMLKKTIGFGAIPWPLLYFADRAASWILSLNDHYWRDSWLKKIGPSSYFYVFVKPGSQDLMSERSSRRD